MIKKLILMILYVFLTVFTFATELSVSENIVTGKLENGLEYYILKNTRPKNRALLNLVVKTGSLDETDKEQGIAHFLEHMAFNGTTKFEKNDIINYLQSIGLSFGADLNAYTSFSETVYTLNTPADEKNLNTTFDVLKEWASEITLKEEDVISERGVILEEWRLRQGLRERIGEIQRKLLYGDSFYSQRFPIGLPEIIETTTPDLLRGFYEKWYQPHNMAIIAVGDFNESEIISMIEKYFSPLKNENFNTQVEHDIPLYSKDSVSYFFDNELTTTDINIIWKENKTPSDTEEKLKKHLTKVLLFSYLNSGFKRESNNIDSPYTSTGIYDLPLNKKVGATIVSSTIKNNNLPLAIENIFDSLTYVSKFGILAQELKLEKENIINHFELIIKNKSSIDNYMYSEGIRKYILMGETFLEPEEEFKISKKLLEKISNEDIINYAKNILKNNFTVFISSNLENLEKDFSEKDILNLINKTSDKTFEKKADNNISLILPKLNLSEGDATFIEKNDNFSTYKLSNGIMAYYKETDFDKDKILIKFEKPIGSSNLNYEEYVNSLFLSSIVRKSGIGEIDYNSIDLYFKGKNFSVMPFVNTYSQGFYISTNKKELAESLNYFRALADFPIFSKEVIEAEISNYSEEIKNRKNSPNYLFYEEYLNTLNSNNPRKKFVTVEDLELINKRTLANIYRNSLTNFYNYSLEVVGSISEEEFLNISKLYFATLPFQEETTTQTSLDIEYPTERVSKTVTKGIDKKSSVLLAYPVSFEYSNENRVLFRAFSDILNDALLKEIREKLGGVYSISSSPVIDFFNHNENYLQISFSTDTKNVKVVTDRVKEVVSTIIDGEFKKEKINDIKNNYKLNYEKEVKENSFWLQYLNRKSFNKSYDIYTPIMYNEIINYNSITSFTKKTIKSDNYIEIILMPEREE